MGASVKRCLASITWAAVGLLSQQIGVPRRKQREQQAQELGGGRDPLIVVREFVHGRGDMGERRHWTIGEISQKVFKGRSDSDIDLGEGKREGRRADGWQSRCVAEKQSLGRNSLRSSSMRPALVHSPRPAPVDVDFDGDGCCLGIMRTMWMRRVRDGLLYPMVKAASILGRQEYRRSTRFTRITRMSSAKRSQGLGGGNEKCGGLNSHRRV